MTRVDTQASHPFVDKRPYHKNTKIKKITKAVIINESEKKESGRKGRRAMQEEKINNEEINNREDEKKEEKLFQEVPGKVYKPEEKIYD